MTTTHLFEVLLVTGGLGLAALGYTCFVFAGCRDARSVNDRD
jgi:hypothetical protein